MKIRLTFVANSSSMSFCMYCIRIHSGDEIKIRNYLNEINNNEVEVYNPFDWDVYVGISILKMKDDQTLIQFKKDCEDKIKKVLELAEVEIIDSIFSLTEINWKTN